MNINLLANVENLGLSLTETQRIETEISWKAAAAERENIDTLII